MIKRETTPTIGIGVNEGMLHLDNSHKLICELKAGLLSRAMRQVLLPPIGGGPYSGK